MTVGGGLTWPKSAQPDLVVGSASSAPTGWATNQGDNAEASVLRAPVLHQPHGSSHSSQVGLTHSLSHLFLAGRGWQTSCSDSLAVGVQTYLRLEVSLLQTQAAEGVHQLASPGLHTHNAADPNLMTNY